MVYLLKNYMHCYCKSLFHFPCTDTEVQICLARDLGKGATVSCSGSHFPSSNHWLPIRTPMLLEKRVASRASRWIVCPDHSVVIISCKPINSLWYDSMGMFILFFSVSWTSFRNRVEVVKSSVN